MRGTRNWRNSVLAAVAAIAVAFAGAYLLGRSGRSEAPNQVVRPAAVVRSGADAVRGPGIPPAPGSTQNAPPDPNAGAPTANLRHVANAIEVRAKSVTTVVTLPPGLNLTARVDVSALFDEGAAQAKRVTQTYDNTSGNRLLVHLPTADGQKRRVNLVISLAEVPASGNPLTYAVRAAVDLEPLYDIIVSPLVFTLLGDCDTVGASEPVVRWRTPDGADGKWSLSIHGRESATNNTFGRTYAEAGQSSNLEEPSFNMVEQDPDLGIDFHKLPQRSKKPLLPGKTHRTTITIRADNDQYCEASLKYRVAYVQRQYPNL
jgi:hypothetical protein